MTCIVALKDPANNRVMMGGDSAITTGHTGLQRSLVDPKVFRRGDLLIGWCGSVRAMQIVQYVLPTPIIPATQDLQAFLIRSFVAEMRKVFTSGGYMQRDDSGSEQMDSWCLIAARGRIFQVDVDFQVVEFADPYGAVGSGAEFAMGSLAHSAKHGPTDIEKRINSALEVSEQFVSSVRRPFTVRSINDRPKKGARRRRATKKRSNVRDSTRKQKMQKKPQ